MSEQHGGAAGFSLIEAMVAMCILTVGAVGMAAVFLNGMQAATSSPNELIATQKAAEAIESVFGARDSHSITWAQLRNASYGGIFVNGARPMKVAGADGVVNTSDDGAVESVTLPGIDQMIGTGDDKVETLVNFTREIRIVDVTQDLRSITVIITYQSGAMTQKYTLTSFISSYA